MKNNVNPEFQMKIDALMEDDYDDDFYDGETIEGDASDGGSVLSAQRRKRKTPNQQRPRRNHKDMSVNDYKRKIVIYRFIALALVAVIVILLCRTVIRKMNQGMPVDTTEIFDETIAFKVDNNIEGLSEELPTIKALIEDNYLKYLNKRVIEFSRIDPLTHVKNRAAYESRAEEIASRMHTDPDYRFAVAMFDVNNLKKVNDELGHDAGDEYLLNATHYICSFFKHSPVYRIGGDEFVAILEDEDFENRGELIIAFRSKLDMIWETENRPVKRVSIASGVRSYDPNVHGSFEDVCKESDIEMYENKKAVKAKYHLGSAR